MCHKTKPVTQIYKECLRHTTEIPAIVIVEAVTVTTNTDQNIATKKIAENVTIKIEAEIAETRHVLQTGEIVTKTPLNPFQIVTNVMIEETIIAARKNNHQSLTNPGFNFFKDGSGCCNLLLNYFRKRYLLIEVNLKMLGSIC